MVDLLFPIPAVIQAHSFVGDKDEASPKDKLYTFFGSANLFPGKWRATDRYIGTMGLDQEFFIPLAHCFKTESEGKPGHLRGSVAE